MIFIESDRLSYMRNTSSLDRLVEINNTKAVGSRWKVEIHNHRRSAMIDLLSEVSVNYSSPKTVEEVRDQQNESIYFNEIPRWNESMRGQ